MLEIDCQATFGTLRLDLHLHSHADVIGIQGHTGSGKSSFLQILAGTERRATGRIRVGDANWLDATHQVPAWQRPVAWVPQDSLLLPHLTVQQNLGFAGRSSPEDINEAAQRLQIANLLSRYPRNLSGGERQRVAIGRALLAKDPLLLMDEPFAALDQSTRLSVRDYVREQTQKVATTVILVSHLPSDGTDWVQETYQLENGELAIE